MTTDQGWRRQAADVAAHHLSWRRGGTGPPLLYLHDAGADTVASPALDELRRDHDVIVLDLPGYGESGPPAGLRDATAVAELLAELCAALDLPPALVAGTSLGGWFAAELAITAPGCVRALLLCSAAGLHAPEDYLFALFAEGRAAAATEDLIADALLVRLPLVEQDVSGEPREVAAAVTAPWVSNLAAAAAMSWHPVTVNPRLLGRLGAIRCATTVLWGELDALIPMEHGRLYAAGIPGAQLRVVRGTGHLVALERPEAFVAAVRGLRGR